MNRRRKIDIRLLGKPIPTVPLKDIVRPVANEKPAAAPKPEKLRQPSKAKFYEAP